MLRLFQRRVQGAATTSVTALTTSLNMDSTTGSTPDTINPPTYSIKNNTLIMM